MSHSTYGTPAAQKKAPVTLADLSSAASNLQAITAALQNQSPAQSSGDVAQNVAIMHEQILALTGQVSALATQLSKDRDLGDLRVKQKQAHSASLAALKDCDNTPPRPTFDRPVFCNIPFSITDPDGRLCLSPRSTTQTYTLAVPPAVKTFDLLVKGMCIVSVGYKLMVDSHKDFASPQCHSISLFRSKDQIFVRGPYGVTTTFKCTVETTRTLPVQVEAYHSDVSVIVCNVGTKFTACF
ncbi:hypothetical protein KIPB_005056 [Kipferlia bialata]|uniref:Uncharacterized protein n=1 Tax=Kipferlia bialata TaxID=797122 RepID=A0A391NW34_9EUKA|nr:hypothetical protein KIPB_005056 [Kipferlia bialata]|eukprot:g5056.t1